jgi:hypothetical protein
MPQEQIKPENPSAPDAPVTVKPVKFIHRQRDQLPTFHADGAWGVVNHHNLIRIGFYTENPPIPTAVIQPVNPDGSPKGEQKLEGADGSEHFPYIRDFQCNIVLPITGAIQVYQMLGNFIRVVQQQMTEQTKAMQSQIEAAQKKAAQQTK